MRSPAEVSTVTKIAKPESDSLSPKCYLNSQTQVIQDFNGRYSLGNVMSLQPDGNDVELKQNSVTSSGKDSMIPRKMVE